jgi:hypothetical protein
VTFNAPCSNGRKKSACDNSLSIRFGKPWWFSMESARFVTAGWTSYSVSIAETSSDSPQGNPSRELHFCGRLVCPQGMGSIILLIETCRVLMRSSAVLRMSSLLGFPFSLAAVFRLIQRASRLATLLRCPVWAATTAGDEPFVGPSISRRAVMARSMASL